MFVAAWLVYRLVGFTVSARFVGRLGLCAVITAAALMGLRPYLDVVSLLGVVTVLYGVLCWQLGVVSRHQIALLAARDLPA